MKILVPRIFGAVGALYFALLGSAMADVEKANSDIYGSWRIIRDASPEGAISARNEKQIRALIGKVAIIRPDKFAFNGSNCARPKFTWTSDDTAIYFYREWRVNSRGMPFGEHVNIVEVDCGSHILYPVDKNHLIIVDDSDFLEAVRVGYRTPAKVAANQIDKKKSGINADIFGTWIIDGADWKGSGYDSASTKEKKAKIYLGMQVFVDGDRFLLNGDACLNPTFKRRRVEKAAYFHDDWRAKKGRLLFLPDMLTVVETGCGTIYPISKKLIIIEDKNGMFFSAVSLSEATAN